MKSPLRCLLLLAAMLVSAPLMAQSDAALRAQTNNGVLGLMSGGHQETYSRIAADLAAVLDGEDLRVVPMLGRGSVQNTLDLLYMRGVDLAIVQADVLEHLRTTRQVPGIERKLRYIARLYDEELHLLVRGHISRLEDLRGRKVNIDTARSGTALTVSTLFNRIGIEFEATHFDQATALQRLRDGEISALALVAGKPVPLFRDIRAGEDLRFLALPLPEELRSTYRSGALNAGDYPLLIKPDEPVQTISVAAVLAAYAWPGDHPRSTVVRRFVNRLADALPELRKAPRHAKWREVDLQAEVEGWRRLPAAQRAYQP